MNYKIREKEKETRRMKPSLAAERKTQKGKMLLQGKYELSKIQQFFWEQNRTERKNSLINLYIYMYR